MKIKVIWNTEKLVIPVGNEQEKVSKLLSDISTRFKAHTPVFEEGNHFVELQTDDQFIFNSNDRIADVITDNSIIRVIDYFTYITNNLKECKQYWLSVESVDFVDDKKKTAYCGYNEKKNKVFIQLGVGPKTLKLEMLGKDDLVNFSKPGKSLISQVEGDGWKSAAYAVVEGSTVKSIELHVKSTSDSQPLIKSIDLNIGKTITKGDEKILQENYKAPTKKYTVPQNSNQGPQITIDPNYVKLPWKSENVSTGDAPLELRQLDDVYIEQYWRSDDGFNNFFVEMLVTNKSDANLSILKFTGEYFANNKWNNCSVYTGHKNGKYNYSTPTPGDQVMTIEPKEVFKMALRANINISGPSLNNQRRIYPSLPNPLRIRFVAHDTNKQTVQIEVEAMNDPLELPSPVSYEKNYHVKPEFYASCDDTACEERIWLGGHMNNDEKRFEIQNKSNSRCVYLYRDDLRRLATKADKQTTEIPHDDLSWSPSSGKFSIKSYILIDPEEKHAYGLKTEMKTTTSSSVTYFLLPPLPAYE